jgi:type II secretory pathway pseudopilin PulG
MVVAARSGMSLIEAEVAMLVLAIGLLATFTLVARAGTLMRRADAEEGAAQVAGEVMDSLVQHGAPGSGSFARGRYAVSWSASPDSTGVTHLLLVVRYDDGGRLRADTVIALAALWPRMVRHVP